MFFIVLVSVLCNMHTSTHSCMNRANSWWWQCWQCMNTCRRKAMRGWAVEVLKLSSCSECLWSQKLSFPSLLHKTWGYFAPCRKHLVLRAVRMVLHYLFFLIAAFIGRKISSWWKSPWKRKHPISLSYVWISWLLKNTGLQSMLCQWPFSF